MVFIALVVIGVALGISSALLLFGAAMVDVDDRSWGKAAATVVIAGIASLFVGIFVQIIFHGVPAIVPVGGIIANLLTSALVMKVIFRTTFGKALGASVISSIVAGICAVLLFGIFHSPSSRAQDSSDVKALDSNQRVHESAPGRL